MELLCILQIQQQLSKGAGPPTARWGTFCTAAPGLGCPTSWLSFHTAGCAGKAALGAAAGGCGCFSAKLWGAGGQWGTARHCHALTPHSSTAFAGKAIQQQVDRLVHRRAPNNLFRVQNNRWVSRSARLIDTEAQIQDTEQQSFFLTNSSEDCYITWTNGTHLDQFFCRVLTTLLF